MKFNLKKIIFSVNQNQNKIVTLFIYLYFFLSAGTDYFVFLNPSLCRIFSILISFAAMVTVYRSENCLLLKKEICFYSIVLFLHFCAILYNGNSYITSIIHSWKYFFTAIALSRIKLNHRMASWCYWAVFQFYAAFMLVGVDPATVPLSVSQNIISIHILLFAALYMIAEPNKKSLQLKLVLLTAMIICIWTGSRTGVIAVAVVIFGIAVDYLLDMGFKNLFHKITKKAWLAIATTTVMLVAAWFVISNMEFSEGSFLYLLTRERLPIWGNVRFVMIGEYFTAAVQSVGDFLFGPSFHAAPTIDFYNGNPHNAFVFAYGNFGVVYFAAILFLLLRAFVRFWKESKPMAFLLLGLALRCMGDIPAFPGIYDALFYYLLFEYFLYQDKDKKTVIDTIINKIDAFVMPLTHKVTCFVKNKLSALKK